MFAPSGEYSESRPFKIFVSLLDKWEIGGPVTDALIYDVFRAVKSHVESKPTGADEVRTPKSSRPNAVTNCTVDPLDCKHPVRSCRTEYYLEKFSAKDYQRDKER